MGIMLAIYSQLMAGEALIPVLQIFCYFEIGSKLRRGRIAEAAESVAGVTLPSAFALPSFLTHSFFPFSCFLQAL